jgi:hypothetical protein
MILLCYPPINIVLGLLFFWNTSTYTIMAVDGLSLCNTFPPTSSGVPTVSFFRSYYSSSSKTIPLLKTSTSLSLFAKQQDYDYDDSDEELFVALFNEKKKETLLSSSSAVASMYFDESTGSAGVPRLCLKPEDIAPLLMTALTKNKNNSNDNDSKSSSSSSRDNNAGLISMWDFSSDITKYIFKNNITEYIDSCYETANEFPTSFYGVALNGRSWEIETLINLVGPKTETSSCWIATQIMKTISSDGRVRRWQWELRKNKRPPNLNCWYVESIGSSDRNGEFEPD